MVRNPKEHGKYKRYEKGISYPIKDSRIWNIHWKHYNDFYKGTRRKPSRKRKYCKHTNMVEQALEIMKGRTIMKGARKKKRKTREGERERERRKVHIFFWKTGLFYFVFKIQTTYDMHMIYHIYMSYF